MVEEPNYQAMKKMNVSRRNQTLLLIKKKLRITQVA
jgi:hypothetical protein